MAMPVALVVDRIGQPGLNLALCDPGVHPAGQERDHITVARGDVVVFIGVFDQIVQLHRRLEMKVRLQSDDQLPFATREFSTQSGFIKAKLGDIHNKIMGASHLSVTGADIVPGTPGVLARAGTYGALVSLAGDDPAVTAVIASNIAAASGNESRSTLLVDADLEHRAVSRALRIPSAPGLADVLRGRIDGRAGRGAHCLCTGALRRQAGLGRDPGGHC